MFSQLVRRYSKALILISLTFLLFYVMCFNFNNYEKFQQSERFSALLKLTLSKSNVDKPISQRVAKEEVGQLFYVNTSQCKMPYVDPFTPEVLKIYKPPKYETCSNESDLVTPIFDLNLKRYVLHINETAARQLLNSSTADYNCCYEEIVHSRIGDSYDNPRPRKYFSQGYVVPLHVNSMLIECHLTSNNSHKLQKDAFFLVQYKVQEPLKQTATDAKGGQPVRKPSVIMFGIDALSRINFRRTMPKVLEHMRLRGWYELQGYNKIADNTLPNLLAILSGYTPETSTVICDLKKRNCFDRFPIIWKDFKEASYLTAYAEDESAMSTFNLNKPGFQKQPTDFYFRPFLKAIEDNMDLYFKSMRYCIGRRVVSSYIYDFCRHFMQRFVDERPIFGLFWTNHFSHDDWQMPALMSDKILQYLLDFEADGAMDSTIMIFLADHGFRYGDLIKFPEGFLEERLPTMFIWLPQWFRDQYPEYAAALEINRNRLTSNYDIYMTLKHIIQLGTPYDTKSKPAFNCLKCQSVFYPMPENRTCADAGIIDHWCTCNPYRIVNEQNLRLQIPNLVSDQISKYLAAKNLSRLCAKLTPDVIDRLELKLNLNERGEHIPQDVQTYRTKFTVIPNGAEFQATVQFDSRTNRLDVDVETISRLNWYNFDSRCIKDKEAKKYCVCNKSVMSKIYLTRLGTQSSTNSSL